MILGLQTLHDLKIIHRDIKCANIFLTKSGTVKLGDLNVSKVAKRGMLSTQTGTPYYASPEVWMDKPYNFKSDIWSLGCVLYEMITGKPPFLAKDMQGLYKAVTQGKVASLPYPYSKDLDYIVKLCLQVKPELRPSCEELLQKSQLLKHKPNDMKEIMESNPELIGTIKVPRNL